MSLPIDDFSSLDASSTFLSLISVSQSLISLSLMASNP